ncbi:hypothetical protein BCV69DRAFT_313786 [Microstroma glucosiphilum]|uniref:BZIP domain-containing protein n=1 Tax=Pseudomicrostroma glucosiphilum TaxID=1684307 RepID=A0A316U968_9BASI|nr:hypothetical protein BCV69DRAFT_313786 [Pseudomicrostroma glucosiphilum]PWN19535.1 hypothetical protein BCV69DRAFT_313786 [Pseudomicrostroma glucosiphilum]
MPPAKKRRSPLDRFTDASPTAISAGFSAAMSIGPQPRMIRNNSASGSGSRGANGVIGQGSTSAGSNNDFGFGEGLAGDAGMPGISWLQNLQSSAGFAGGGAGGDSTFGDLGGSDDDSDADNAGTSKQGRKGAKKKAPKRKKATEDDEAPASGKSGEAAGDEDDAAVLRKAQNRIAQREFRQRKQQYIRALEARVELLSTDHDEQVDRLRFALRGLLSENNTLRSLLGSLGRFIGEGLLGGPLQQAGLTREELFRTINGRSEKTMTDAWQNWPGAKECEALRQLRQEANIPVDGLPEMRGSPGPSSGDAQKAAKNSKRSQKGTTAEGTPAAQPSGSRTTQQSQTPQNGTPMRGQESFDASEGFEFSMLPSISTNSLGGFSQQQQVATPGSATSAGGVTNLHPFNGPMPPSAFGFSSTMDAQDDALMASLFGADALADGTNAASFFQSSNGGTELLSQGAAATSSPAASLVQTNTARSLPPSQQAAMRGFDANNAPNGIPQSAQAFIDSLRNFQDESGFQRMTALANQLARVRASQGRTDFVPIFHPDPSRCDSAASVDSQDGGTLQSEEDMQRMTQAAIRMSYEMSNYRRNASYHLPALLRPTHLQLTRPHDPIIDSAPFPSLRDALILNRANLNLDEVMFSILSCAKVGDGDVFSEKTYQLDHAFLLRYPSLATQETVNATNRWRAGQGMGPLSGRELHALVGSGGGGVGMSGPSSNKGSSSTGTGTSTGTGSGTGTGTGSGATGTAASTPPASNANGSGSSSSTTNAGGSTLPAGGGGGEGGGGGGGGLTSNISSSSNSTKNSRPGTLSSAGVGVGVGAAPGSGPHLHSSDIGATLTPAAVGKV